MDFPCQTKSNDNEAISCKTRKSREQFLGILGTAIKKRLPFFLDAPLKHREVFSSPLIAPTSLGKYLDTDLIKCVDAGGEMALKAEVRPIQYEWVKALYLEAKERNIEFYFHQCDSMFLKDGMNIGKWNLNDQIKRAEEIQHA